MTFDASQAFRYSMDFTLAFPSIVGVSPYQIYLVEITNDQIGFDDSSASRITKETRILIADGYRTYAALDGYLNPMIDQEEGQQLIISGGQLTNNILFLGPLVFPYNENNFSGGFDAQLFQPVIGSNNKVQIYVQLRGPGLSPKSNFFDVKEIKIADAAGLSYIVVLSANDRTVV